MSDVPASSSRTRKRHVIAIAVVTALCAWIGWRRSDAQAPPSPAPAATPAAAPAPAATPAPGAQAQNAAAAAPAPVPTDPTKARIEFITSPPVTATVTWGTTKLGRITPGKPLVVVRPRDSGPLDVVVRAPGFMPVHTRAHTFADNKLVLRLTRPENKTTLLGYRAPLDAGLPLLPDGGIPPVLSEMPLSDAPFSPLQWPAQPGMAPLQTPVAPPTAPAQTPAPPPAAPKPAPAPAQTPAPQPGAPKPPAVR